MCKLYIYSLVQIKNKYFSLAPKLKIAALFRTPNCFNKTNKLH